jgi:spore coat protein A
MTVERRQFFRLTGAAGALLALKQATTPSVTAVETATAQDAVPTVDNIPTFGNTPTVGNTTAIDTPASQAAAGAATRLSGAGYKAKFTQKLHHPQQVILTGKSSSITMDASQFTQQVLTGYPATRLYGFGLKGQSPSWPGPTINATAKSTLQITWRNRLPKGSVKLAKGGHLLPVDASLLDTAMTALPAGEKPISPHLHGSHAEWESDGYPEAWFTQSNHHGSFWRKPTDTYDNSQVGGTLWYHDHAHGITRLNVYAGLAGAYVLRDATEAGLIKRSVLPSAAYEREILLQDRGFTDDGQLLLDTADPSGGIDLSIFPDFMMANGVPWPVFDVEPRKYRFRLVNGSDSRVYVLLLSSGGPILVVGTELSLLPKAVSVTRLPIAPGERYDVVLNFSGLTQGTEIILQNRGVDGALVGFATNDGTVTNRPSDNAYGVGPSTDAASTALVMKFRVRHPLSKAKKGSVGHGSGLGPALPKLKATKTRAVITFPAVDKQGRTMEMLGTLAGGTKEWMDPVTEVVTKGTTEIWEIYNTSNVAHPIHLHLVNFQLLDRASFTHTFVPRPLTDGGTGALVTVTGRGKRRPPEPYEGGRKDTVICYPDEVTRIIATFDRAGAYVWHCHILHHEDHDMMRPITVR